MNYCSDCPLLFLRSLILSLVVLPSFLAVTAVVASVSTASGPTSRLVVSAPALFPPLIPVSVVAPSVPAVAVVASPLVPVAVAVAVAVAVVASPAAPTSPVVPSVPALVVADVPEGIFVQVVLFLSGRHVSLPFLSQGAGDGIEEIVLVILELTFCAFVISGGFFLFLSLLLFFYKILNILFHLVEVKASLGLHFTLVLAPLLLIG